MEEQREDYQWYVVQTMPGQEGRTQKALEENREKQGVSQWIFEIFVPSEKVSEIKKGEQKIKEKRLWPGYLLIKMVLNDDSWRYVKETNGVIGFLGGGRPVPLSRDEVEEIVQEIQERKKKGTVVHRHKLEVGSYIKIVDGVFVNCVGKVLDVQHERGRLSAEVLIFGRETRVDDLEFWQVEEMPVDIKHR